MVLRDILYKVNIRSIIGSTSLEIEDVQSDSRKITKGSLFIAVRGVAVDGHRFIKAAIELGAVAVVCEELPSTRKEEIVYVQVENSVHHWDINLDCSAPWKTRLATRQCPRRTRHPTR